MKNTVITIINVVINLTLGVVLLSAMFALGKYKAKHGTATKYTNVKYTDSDEKFNVSTFFKKFSVNQEAVSLTSDQGLIACVHGGFAEFIIAGKKESHFSMASKFEKGDYTLVSCCNGSHQDFDIFGKSFKRDPNTISYYETILLPYNDGTFICWADKLVCLYTCILNIQFWKHIPRVLKQKNWK